MPLLSMLGLNVIHIYTGHNECNEHETINLFDRTAVK